MANEPGGKHPGVVEHQAVPQPQKPGQVIKMLVAHSARVFIQIRFTVNGAGTSGPTPTMPSGGGDVYINGAEGGLDGKYTISGTGAVSTVVSQLQAVDGAALPAAVALEPLGQLGGGAAHRPGGERIVLVPYVLKNLNKHSSYGFDICTTSSCQVYHGMGSLKADYGPSQASMKAMPYALVPTTVPIPPRALWAARASAPVP